MLFKNLLNSFSLIDKDSIDGNSFLKKNLAAPEEVIYLETYRQ